jgi:predicted DNA-binding antitoxin AbrB/MazE fold protein
MYENGIMKPLKIVKKWREGWEGRKREGGRERGKERERK